VTDLDQRAQELTRQIRSGTRKRHRRSQRNADNAGVPGQIPERPHRGDLAGPFFSQVPEFSKENVMRDK